MSQTQWNPNPPGGAPMHAGYQGPAYPPQGFPVPAQLPPQPPAADMTSEGVLNDDVTFDLLSKLPEQALNQSTRFCFLLFDANGDLRFRKGDMFYPKIAGKAFPFLAPPTTDPLYASCVDRWGFPQPRFASIVLAYNTDREGNFIQTEGFKYELYSLGFNKAQGPWFRSTNKRRPFIRHDLMRTCTKESSAYSGTEYQFTVEETNVFATLPDDMRATILDKALFLHNTYLGPSIGRPRKSEEIALILRDIDPATMNGSPQQQASPNMFAASPHAYQPQMGFNGQQPAQIQGPTAGYNPQYPQHAAAMGGQHMQPQMQPRPPQTFAAAQPQQPAPTQQPRQQVTPDPSFGQALAAASHQMPADAAASDSDQTTFASGE